jgi:hypothetical protein
MNYTRIKILAKVGKTGNKETKPRRRKILWLMEVLEGIFKEKYE